MLAAIWCLQIVLCTFIHFHYSAQPVRLRTAVYDLQDFPALRLVSKMPRYADQYTLLVSRRDDTDQLSSVLQLTPWLNVLRSSIPRFGANDAQLSR